jgi:membrane protein DedA with SNARE-associated domain
MTSPDEFASEPGATGYRAKPERTITGLLADLADELRALFRLEIALFRVEATEKLRRLGIGLAALAVGVFLAFSGWMALLAAAVLALAERLRPWLAALIVGLAAILLGALLLYLGKRWLDARLLVPQRTLSSLREDEAWIRDRMR